MSARPGTQVNPRSPRQAGSPRASYGAVLRLLSGALAVLGLGGAVATARAQDDSARPSHGYPTVYAVRDARVVAAAGKVHDPGTVVVRQGVIEAVGPSKDVAIPLDAEVIEGKGLVVYPGFIDLFTTVGQRAGVDRSATGQGQHVDLAETPLAATPADNRRGLTPEFETARTLELTDAVAEPRRRLGFTALLSVPSGAIATGQSALVSTSGFPRRESIVSAPVALHVHLAPLPETAATMRPDVPPQQSPSRRRPTVEHEVVNPYPRALMGAIAHLRQAMVDADYHHRLLDFDHDGAGLRVPYDPALQALWLARCRKLPVWWRADSRDEIHRALDLAAEFGTTAVIVGGREAAKVAQRLKAEHVAVVLLLSFPEEPRVPTEQEYRNRPLLEQDEPLAVLAHRRDRWKEQVGTAAALARMEIPFAFATLGLERLDDFPARLRSLLGQGLSAEQALSALTQQAATIAGAERRLGSLEPGKLGHLIALSAPLEDEQARVKLVLIDGLKFEIKPPEPGAGEGHSGARRGGAARGSSPAGRPARPDSTAPAPPESPPGPPETSPASTAKTSGATARQDEQKSPDAAKPKLDLPPAKEKSPDAAKLKSDAPPADKNASEAGPGKPPPSGPDKVDKPRSEATKAGATASPPANADATTTTPSRTRAPSFVDVATEFDSDRTPKLKTGGSVLIQDATILTVTRGTIPRGSILIEDGKIAAVGPDLKSRSGVAVINALGLVAMPGIIDTHSHIAIQGGINEYSLSIVPEVRVKDVVTGDDISIYRAVAGGTTTARLLHGSSNTIGGQDAVIKLRYGKPGRDLIIRDAPQGVKFALGENVIRQRGRFPNSRMGVQSVIEQAFEEARAYRARWDRHEAAVRKEGAKAGPPPRTDLRLEALVHILDGSIKIHSHCYRGDEILMLLSTAQRYGIKVQSLQHVMEGYKVAAEIALHGASCSTFSDWWAHKVEAYDAIPYNAALLARAGASVCIKSDSEELIRHLNLEAAKIVKYGGVTEAEALAMITINPARQLGLESRLGSIEVGKDADIVLFNAHPFDAFSRCQLTLIDGEVYFRRPEPDGKLGVRPGNLREMPQAPEPARHRSIEIPAQPRNVFALIGGTLHTACGPTIQSGTLIIRDGEIAAIGSDRLGIPPEAQSIDARGLDIWPGLIDAGSTIGLWEIDSLPETRDFADSSRFEPELRTSVALRSDSEHLPVTRANGILTAYVQPTGGLISGQGCVINLRGWVPRELLVQDQVALNVTIPAFVPRPAGGQHRGPRPGKAGETGHDPHVRRKEQLEAIRAQFRKAAWYGDIVAQARVRGLATPPFDLRLSALVPYARGQKPVIFQANHRTEILDALAIAKELKLKAVISGASEAWKVAGAIKEADVPVIVAGTLNVPRFDYDPYDAEYANPARLHEAGVTVAIRSSASGPGAATAGRNLPYEAATAVAFGLPENVALQALTLTPARILGVSDRLGSLEVGKRANLVLTAGHIFQPTSTVLLLFIDGKPVAPESRHTQLYGRYSRRLSDVKAGLAPLGLDRSGTDPARVPERAAAVPSPTSP